MKRFLLLLLILFSVALQPSWSQESQGRNWRMMIKDPDVNFYDLQKAFYADWEGKEIEKGKGYKQFKRYEAFMLPRVYPTGHLPTEEITRVLSELVNKSASRSNAAGNWSPLGPTNVPANGLSYPSFGIGRVNCIRFDPQNNNNIWIGTPGGGLWKTTNGGSTWTSNTDQFASLGVSDIAIHPTNSNIMYLATGDFDASDTYSIGVVKSIDGGATWQTTGFTNATSSRYRIGRLIINPSNPDILIAATNNGIMRTANGGTSWTNIISGVFSDVEFKPGDPNTVYAASYGSSSTARMYVSTNAGTSFTLASGTPTSDALRISVAVTPANPSVVYALICANNSGYKGLYKSTNSGVSYTLVNSSPNILASDEAGSGTGGQGWYDLALAVSPIDENLIYVGGVNAWKSTNGGTSFSITGHWYGGGAGNVPFVHADHHYHEFQPNSSIIFSGNDGGIRKSTNNGASWTDLSDGLQISQFYRISTARTNANIVYAGAQDNGTNRYSSGAWSSVYGGDGMQPLVDYNNSNIVYASVQYGGLQRSSNGGVSFSSIKPSAAPSGAWITPYVLHPTIPSTIYAGYDDIYKSTNSGTTWTKLTTNVISGDLFEVMAISQSNPNVLYAGTPNKLRKSVDAGVTWTNIVTGLPISQASITSIAISNTDENKIWVTFSGYVSTAKVYYSANGGTSWTNISTGLPNIPINTIEYQNGSEDAIYVGTDVGVYYKSNTQAWMSFMTNLPNVKVQDLDIHYATGKIRAATFGRGLWESDLQGAPVVAPIADFTVTSTTVNAGSAVSFTDLSVNSPTSWQWTFTGGTPSSSSSQNPTNIIYNTPGTYTVSLTATNSSGSNTNTKTAYITVSAVTPNECKSWIPQASGFLAQSRGIVNMDVVNQNVVWAVAFDGSGANAPVTEYTKTIDGSATWQVGSINVGSSNYSLANISATHKDTAWACIYPRTTAIAAQGIYKTINGGTSWVKQSTASYSNASSFVNFVHFFNGLEGVAQGDPIDGYFEIYTTNNGGATWTRVNTANIPAPIATDEFGTVGYFTTYGNAIWFSTTKGRIFKSTNKGATWTASSTPLATNISITNLAFRNANNGLLTGVDPNTQADIGMYRTTDGGTTWALVNTTTAGINVKSDLEYVPGTVATYYITGSANGSAGSAYSTDDGVSWTAIDNEQHTSLGFYNNLIGWSGGFNSNVFNGGMFKINTPSINANINTPSSTTFCENEPLLLTANAGVNYTYKWYLNDAPIPGANLVNYEAISAGNYKVEVFEGLCSDVSDVLTLTTKQAPGVPVVSSSTTNICSGDSAVLQSSVASSYQWYKNNEILNGATQSQFVVKETGSYKVRVGNAIGCFNTSLDLSINVTDLPLKPIVSSTATSFCDGENINLTSSVSTNIQWYKDGEIISGRTNATLIVDAPGNYYVKASSANGLCSIFSDTVEVIVHPLPLKPTITKDSTILTSSPALFYEWRKNGDPIPFASAQTYTVTETGSYSVKITDVNGCSNISDNMSITITGLEKDKVFSFVNIYPNPSNGEFTLVYSLYENTVLDITMINVLGQVIQEVKKGEMQHLGTHELKIKQKNAGVYLLRLKSKDGIKEIKFVVN